MKKLILEKDHKKTVFFPGNQFVRIAENGKGLTSNTYYDWDSISSVRTISNLSE